MLADERLEKLEHLISGSLNDDASLQKVNGKLLNVMFRSL